MKFALALVALSAIALAPAANASDARLTDCVQMAKQVSAALESAQPGTSTDAARQQANVGRSYCGSQMYTQGVAHYSKALQLLGKN
jgi:hypothetical protein